MDASRTWPPRRSRSDLPRLLKSSLDARTVTLVTLALWVSIHNHYARGERNGDPKTITESRWTRVIVRGSIMPVKPQSLGRRTFLLTCGATVVLVARVAGADDHVVVANATAGVAELSFDDAKRVLAARQAFWQNGCPVLIVVPPKSSSSMQWMLDRILHMPEGAYRRHLMNQAFKGTTREPILTVTVEDAVKEVSTKRGAISVIPAGLVVGGTRVVSLH
jgi:hypothetical protein